MSFILDALKKAESERNRNAGPVLMDVRIAPPRRRLPAWAWVLGIVLLANLGILAWLLLRTPPDAKAPTQATSTTSSAAATTGDTAGAASAALPTTGGTSPPDVTTAASPYAPVSGTAPPSPATSAAPGATILAPVAVPNTPPDYDALPTAKDLATAGVPLPPVVLNLHVYDADASHRYVLLNGLRITEGEYTPDGVKVEAITPRGVVLEADGRRFLLPAGG